MFLFSSVDVAAGFKFSTNRVCAMEFVQWSLCDMETVLHSLDLLY